MFYMQLYSIYHMIVYSSIMCYIVHNIVCSVTLSYYMFCQDLPRQEHAGADFPEMDFTS